MVDSSAILRSGGRLPTLADGDHEEIFLKALEGDPRLVRYFVQIGGEPTISSYGLTGDDYYHGL